MDIRKKVARKLIAGIVIFSGLLSIIITISQLYFEFQRDKGIIDSQLSAIKQTSLPSLTEAVWLADNDQIKIHLSSMQEYEHIGYVELTTDEGNIFRYGNRDIKDSLIQKFDIYHKDAAEQQMIGSLLIKGDLHKAYYNLYDRLGFVLISNTLKTLLVALFIYFLVHNLVIKYLVRIADYLHGFNINEKTPLLKLNRGKHAANDELQLLEASVNTMAGNLYESVEKLTLSEQKKSFIA